MVAGSSYQKNPIVHAWATGTERCEDLLPEKVRETAVNEPLINWHSIDGDHALDSIRSTDGWATHVSDKALVAQAGALRAHQGLSVLPASTAGIYALISRHRRDALPGDRYVAILTGRK